MADKLAPDVRHKVTYEGRTIYEWSQTIQDVDVFVPLPAPGIPAKALFVKIDRAHLTFGIKPNPPYLDADLFSEVITTESTWTLEDGELHISLQKATQGEIWKGAIKGHELNQLTAEEDQRRLLLERFQLEHPGMDFSGAEMKGHVPDPSTFMGGFAKQR